MYAGDKSPQKVGQRRDLGLATKSTARPLYLERAGVVANGTLLLKNEPVRSNLSPSHSARQVWMVHAIGC